MRATATAQPNIALIKYWGKRDTALNLPAVGSISITLSDLYTRMTVDFDDGLEQDVLHLNDEPNDKLLPRLSNALDIAAGGDRPKARIISECNFPIAAGLASSASSFAAIVVAASAAMGIERSVGELANLAGRASGSAARSLYGGFVELENSGDAVVVGELLSADDWPLDVVVAVTATGPKPVGSTEAMEISRKTSPFYDRWVSDQPDDLASARDAIASRNFSALASIAEHNCLKMHSVMWSSRPAIVYWNDATLACLQTIRQLQSDGVAVFFTIDAGPQVKAVCDPADTATVEAALSATDGVRDILTSGLGEGARLT
ncbi:MAG: diphosphomevalonate decarboxylase [Woeseiaceae bacterium]|nr:diphosphomevalonate decarboxylase [Woeseiaceae bacterium]